MQLVGRREGVGQGELGPGDGDHLAGGVELHGARAQRDHGAVQRQVLVRQLADVAQHAGLAVVTVENRVRHEAAGAAQRFGDQRGDAFFKLFKGGQLLTVLYEQAPQRGDVFSRGGFVQGDAHKAGPAAGVATQVDLFGHGVRVQGVSRCGAAAVHGQGVERGAVQERGAQRLQALGQHGGVAGNPLGDALEALGPVVDRVHAGDHCRQHLCGADVRRRLFAADVLLTRLQRQAVGRLAVRVHAHAHQSAGHGALVLVTASQVGGVRAARAHGHAKALGGAHHDVGAHLAWGLEQHQGHQVGGQDEGGLLAVDQVGADLPVGQPAAAAGVLVEGGKVVVLSDGRLPFVAGADDLDGDAQGCGASLDHFERLRVHVAADDEYIALGLDRALGQRHGLGGGGGFVEHGGVGDRHAGQVAHHGLEIDQRFHAALRNFGLVRGVGGVPGGVFEDVAQDDPGRVGAVVALTDEALVELVLARNAFELFKCSRFGDGCRQLHALAAGDRARHDGFDQGAARGLTNDAQHERFVLRADADVARNEFGRVFEIAEGAVGGHQHGRLR